MVVHMEGQAPEPGEEGQRARQVFSLIVTVFAIDAVAVVAGLFCAIVLGWPEIPAFLPLIAIMVLGTYYFVWKMRKIRGEL